MMPTPDNTDSDLEVSPQERTVSNSPNSVQQFAKTLVNLGSANNVKEIQFGDKYYGQPAANPVPLSPEEQKEAVLLFLQAMEENFKYIRLFHTPQQIVLKKQYIPIQVTLERRYKHEVETTLSYAESEAESKRIYALKGFQEETKETIVSWEDAKKEIKKEAKQENYKIIVLADPGMGKSTLLKMEAGTISQSQKQKLSENQINVEDIILPIFLRLSDLVKDSAEVIDIIPQIVRREYPRIPEKFQQLLQEKLKRGKCLLLLDALDEVPKEHRIDLKDKLKRFTDNYPCSIISTSRIVGYDGNFIEDAKEVEIVPFSQKQTEEYIETWFANAADYINDDSVSAKGLIEELRHKPQISGLVQNPLLLSLLCSLYQEKGLKLPARRVQVYEKTVNYMLSQWSQHRKSLSDGEIEAKRQLLEELAYHFSSSDKEIFSGSELFEQIKKYKDKEGKSSNKLMTELTEEYGILQKLNRESNEYLFLHRTFQEYLTACYLNRAIKKNQKDGIALAKKLFWQYDWHETLTLLAGLMENPQPLLTAILNAKDDIFKTLLLLAGRCTLEIQENHPSIKDILNKVYTFWKRYPSTAFIESTVIAIGKGNPQMCCELQKALNDSDGYLREHAAEALGKIGNPQAVNSLIVALHDSDSSMRRLAAEALGKIGNPQAVDGLIAALNDSHSDVRWSAVKALGKIGNPQAVDGLIATLNHSERYVRQNAAEALGKIGNPQAVDGLIAALNDSDIFVRCRAAEALEKIGNPQAVESLIAALNHLDSDVRWNAAEALGKIGNPQAVDGLIAALNHSERYVRQNAAEALGKIGNPQAVDGLIAALNDSDSEVRWSAAEALGNIGNPQALESLIAALNDSDSEVRWSAAVVLGKIGNPQAVESLIAALNHLDSDVRWSVAVVLGKMGNPQAVDGLIAALNHSHSDMRWSAVQALGKIGNPQAVDGLIAALNDSDSSVRWSAAEALGKIGNPQAVDGLIAALNDSDSSVRRDAAEALGKIGNPQAVDGLIAARNHLDSDVRRRAAEALGKIGNPQAVDGLIAALNDSDSSVRRDAAEALGKIGNPQAVDGLIAALNHLDSSVRSNAAEALGKIGNPQAVDGLIAALNHLDSSVRSNAAEALGKIGNPQAVDGLIAALNHLDSSVRRGAAQALGNIGNQETLEKLIKLPEINIDEPEIFSLARMLAVRFSKQKLPFIPVYREQIKYSEMIAKTKRLGRVISYGIGLLREELWKRSQ